MPRSRIRRCVLSVVFSLALALSFLASRAHAQSIVGADLNVTVASSDVSVYLDFDNSNGQGFLHTEFISGDDFEVGFFSDEEPYFRSHVGTTLVDSDRIPPDYFFLFSDRLLGNRLSEGVHTVSSSRPLQGGDQNVYLDSFYASGFPFDAGSTYWGGGGTSSGYLGFSFFNPVTSQTNYGFVELNYNDDANTLTLVRFAYDNTGAGILAGATSAIPEPATTAALMTFAAGAAVAIRRRSLRKVARIRQ